MTRLILAIVGTLAVVGALIYIGTALYAVAEEVDDGADTANYRACIEAAKASNPIVTRRNPAFDPNSFVPNEEPETITVGVGARRAAIEACAA